MARGKLWSVKGVSTQAREAAKAAAQNSDQPIGVWIDQAILMSGDDEVQNETDVTPATDEVSELDIVAILQALEERVASHADRITEQLGPVRDSISDLGTRLEQLEHAQRNTASHPTTNTSTEAGPSTSLPPLPKTEDPAPRPEPEAEVEAEAEAERSPADSEFDASPPGHDETPHSEPDPAYGAPPLHDAPESTPDAGRPIDPSQITEADIHAADAALKSELTGLFDDGTHRPNAGLHAPRDDPFMSRRPPRRTSRAPLVFVLAILVAAAAGIAAVVWFEFLSPEMRKSLTTDLLSETGEVESSTPPSAPPAATPPTAAQPAPAETPAPTPVPQAAEPATPAPSATPTTPTPPDTATVPAPAPSPVDETASLAAEPEPDLDTSDAAQAIAKNATGNAELDALREDASTGIATAQNELGVRYLVGRGVAQDYGEAAFWLRKAAAQDMTNAQYNLGVLYESGRGVEPDPTEALIWFHSAAENGHGRAQMAVAAAYAAGRGIARNPDEALKWLRRAAESNVAEAQFSLGNILSTSPASQESLVDAYYWYRVADSNGLAKASERADQIAAQLTPEERAGVNARVSHFIAQKIPRGPKPSAPSAEPAAPQRVAPKPEVAPAPATSTTLTAANTETVSRDQINAIQALLNQLGFDPGRPDGTVGTKTRDAIRNYQRELGLSVNGEPSVTLLNHLRQIAGDR